MADKRPSRRMPWQVRMVEVLCFLGFVCSLPLLIMGAALLSGWYSSRPNGGVDADLVGGIVSIYPSVLALSLILGIKVRNRALPSVVIAVLFFSRDLALVAVALGLLLLLWATPAFRRWFRPAAASATDRSRAD